MRLGGGVVRTAPLRELGVAGGESSGVNLLGAALLPRVKALVELQSVFAVKALPTQGAVVRLGAGVNMLVPVQSALLGKGLSALGALERPLPSVNAVVLLQRVHAAETPPTLRTEVGLLPGVSALVSL